MSLIEYEHSIIILHRVRKRACVLKELSRVDSIIPVDVRKDIEKRIRSMSQNQINFERMIIHTDVVQQTLKTEQSTREWMIMIKHHKCELRGVNLIGFENFMGFSGINCSKVPELVARCRRKIHQEFKQGKTKQNKIVRS